MTQDGREVRFYDDLIQGKVVAVNFFFTHCKDLCPAETANLVRLDKMLGDRVGRDVHLYSISIDPQYDSPEALRHYAAKFKASRNWIFLTGKADDVALIRKKLGLLGSGEDAGKLENHKSTLIVGNEATAQWMKRSAFDDPGVLKNLLVYSLQKLPVSSGSAVSYAAAQIPKRMTAGEELFKSRCDSCHSPGGDARLGPGLVGILQRRNRAWLARWIKVPDELLAHKDPVAMELLAHYGELQMPNLKLSNDDVEALMGYLQTL